MAANVLGMWRWNGSPTSPTQREVVTTTLPGSTYKRCSCRNPVTGRFVATTCPDLVLDGHGSWHYAVRVRHGGALRQIRRGGFTSQQAAMEAAALRVALDRQAWPCDAWRSPRYRTAAADMLAEDIDNVRLVGGTGWLYAIVARPYLKLGYSNDPTRRLKEMRSAGRGLLEPADLDHAGCALWLTFSASAEDEKTMHHLARNYRASGEWYYADPGLIAALEVLHRR